MARRAFPKDSSLQGLAGRAHRLGPGLVAWALGSSPVRPGLVALGSSPVGPGLVAWALPGPWARRPELVALALGSSPWAQAWPKLGPGSALAWPRQAQGPR